jgi:hypothetical protein
MVMMQPILQELQDALLRTLGDEVDLMSLYGSQLNGATHKMRYPAIFGMSAGLLMLAQQNMIHCAT